MTYLLTVTHKGITYTKEFSLLSTAAATLNRIQAANYSVDLACILNSETLP